MSAGGGGGGDEEVTAPCDRSLNRRSSKSRLEKQHEVEDEDPPGGRGPVERDDEEGVASPDPTQLTLKPLQIPETRVESFDNADMEGDDKGAPSKSKVLVRSHAMCGDDDTKLTARTIDQQSSKGSAGSSLSRDSSNELYTDSTGINLEEFIINTLHKNPRDRTFLLDLELTLVRFIQDQGKQIHRFPAMSSYNRMLVHRIAAYFGLDHNVDQSGQAVVVSKMQTTRIPETPFRDYIKHDNFTDEPKKMLLKRDAQSYEEAQARTSGQPFDIRKARSFEEREEQYAKARARIFNQQDSSSSVEGVVESPVRPWSSTDSSSDHSQASFLQIQRAQLMHKACSFGGVSTLYRGDATKLSPRRSNTESTRDVGNFARQPTIPEAASGPSSPVIPAGQPVIFAVANIEQVPPGAVIINTQTGQPYLNPDGSVYRHVVLPHRPVSTGPPSTPAAAAAAAYGLPFCATPLSSEAAAMQQLNLVQASGANMPSESSHTPQMYFGATPQVYTYVMSQNQQQQGSEGSPQRFPSMATAYMQPVSVQYQESSPYAMHPGQIAYTQAPSQSTGGVASTAAGYPLYYQPGSVGLGVTGSPVAALAPSSPAGNDPTNQTGVSDQHSS